VWLAHDEFIVVADRSYKRRPRKRWIDDILKWSGMSLQQVAHHAQDREKWKSFMAGPTFLEPRCRDDDEFNLVD